jgi:hypothetical protein
MNPAELRAITAQGPAVVMSSRDDFLRLLDERDGMANAGAVDDVEQSSA